MPQNSREYIAIDLKSFYASVECVERGLDPLDANLLVADRSRTEKTICLAVSPALKALGLPGRPRLFEAVELVDEANRRRALELPGRRLCGVSASARELAANPALAASFIVAPPRMALYIDYSSRIYDVYLRFFAPEDIHVYSVDEVFIDISAYRRAYRMPARELAARVIREVLRETGITATAGIGPNMYLCKVAMDIVAKKMPAGKDGVRIAELTEESYRRLLWNHRPLTDFWRVGRGIARRLAGYGIETMGQIARLSLRDENFFYRLFGVNAELLIDHAWGWEPVEMADVKSYRPEATSLSNGQVLPEPYTFRQSRIIVQEMAETIAFFLLERRLLTDRITITVGYDVQNLIRPEISSRYSGAVHADHYGRLVPAHSHGTMRLAEPTASASEISRAVTALFDRLANPLLLVRRLGITACRTVPEQDAQERRKKPVQLKLFVDYDALRRENERKRRALARERSLFETLLSIKKSFGKNAILKGLNYAECAMQRQRNMQIGGHNA